MRKNKSLIQLELFFRSRGNSRRRADVLRKMNIFHSYGFGGLYQPLSIPSEPWLVSIGNNVSIAANVTFITHDVIQSMLRDMHDETNYPKGKCNYYMGSIEIFDNCVIGANSTILYNTKIGPNAIVAAGSVITKNVPPDSIVGGNPARVIGSLSELAKKRAELCSNRPDDGNNIQLLNDFFWNENRMN